MPKLYRVNNSKHNFAVHVIAKNAQEAKRKAIKKRRLEGWGIGDVMKHSHAVHINNKIQKAKRKKR